MRSINRAFRLSVALIFSVFSLVTGAAIADAFEGQTTRVSVNSAGILANMSASSGVLSGDGRYVVFASSATNLIAGVVTTTTHVYRHENRPGGATVLVSVTPTGDPGNDVSNDPSVSANGRYVVFDSFATDLVAGDTPKRDVFLRDMVEGTTSLVSGATAGVVGLPGNSFLSGVSGAHEVSDDGNYVVFMSLATNLVPGATNGVQQVYWKDMAADVVVRVSTNPAGEFGDRTSLAPAISADGLVVAFESSSQKFSSSMGTAQVFTRVMPNGLLTLESAGAAAIGLRAGAPTLSANGRYLAFESAAPLDPEAEDKDGTLDVFLRDRDPSVGTTVLASPSPNEVPGAASARPSISGDGRWVAFDSLDELIVDGDVGGLADVFLYDSLDRTVVLVSRNDAGEQANKPSGLTLGGASVSADGNLVLFGSTASNLVAEESNVFNQLYLRKLVDDTPQPPQVTFEWLAPVSDSFSVGRNLPVKFTVHDLEGSPVFDASVEVDVVDSLDAVRAGTYKFGGQPSRSVTWSGDTYHVNVDTRDLEAGMYWLRVRFSSATLTAEFTLPTNGTASAVRSRLRD